MSLSPSTGDEYHNDAAEHYASLTHRPVAFHVQENEIYLYPFHDLLSH